MKTAYSALFSNRRHITVMANSADEAIELANQQAPAGKFVVSCLALDPETDEDPVCEDCGDTLDETDSGEVSCPGRCNS